VPSIEELYAKITNRLPPRLAARIDLMRPSFYASWGGPLNGQERRREIVREIAQKVPFDAVYETGTYRGTSTEFFVAVFGVPVKTVEKSRRNFVFSNRRLQPLGNLVQIERGDSRDFLRRFLAEPDPAQRRIFVYLDAHWNADLPLAEEVRIVVSSRRHAVIMVDDFKVPYDSDYGYDDYGEAKALTEEYLPADDLIGWHLFYPQVSAQLETGLRRGCCVLASPIMAQKVRSVTSLVDTRVF
jgi:hypothetical protein